MGSKSEEGFKTLYNWLEDEREQPDALANKADRRTWLVVMPLDTFLKMVKECEDVGYCPTCS